MSGLLSWFFRPPPADSETLNKHQLAIRAKHAAIEAVDAAKLALSAAEARLDNAQQTYDDEDSWSCQRVIATAEEVYEEALIDLENAELKVTWEKDEKWKQEFPRTIEHTLSLLASVDWERLRPLRESKDT